MQEKIMKGYYFEISLGDILYCFEIWNDVREATASKKPSLFIVIREWDSLFNFIPLKMK